MAALDDPVAGRGRRGGGPDAATEPAGGGGGRRRAAGGRGPAGKRPVGVKAVTARELVKCKRLVERTGATAQ